MHISQKKHWHVYNLFEKRMWRVWVSLWSVSGHLEVVWRSKIAPGFRIHLGNESSDTPFDWHISLYWLAIFGDLNFPGMAAFCKWIGRGHKRDISLHFHARAIWWNLWYDDDMGYDSWHDCNKARKPKLYPWRWGRDKYRSWMCLRSGNLELNPLTAFWGHRLYKYEAITRKHKAIIVINQMIEDSYQVEMQLMSVTRQREFGPKWARRSTDEGLRVEWTSDKGIPYRNDYKKRNLTGSSAKIDFVNLWQAQAKKAIADSIIETRRKYKFDPTKIA